MMGLEDLHPLIAGAAAEPWERMAYADAVASAWRALRDMLRDKLDSPLDGIRLVQAIGEGDPKLQLTDYSNETDQSMHRGLFNMLKGVVAYVRNPMAHDAGPPGGNDPIRCFEYLAVMSICARHVANARQPMPLEEIVRQASQRRFSGSSEAVADLVNALPPAHLPALVDAVSVAYQAAVDEGRRRKADNLRRVYLAAIADLDQSAPATRKAVRVCARLLADDHTFDVGMDLLTLPVFNALSDRHRANAVHALQDDTRAGRIGSGKITEGGRYIYTLFHVFDGFADRDRTAMLRIVVDALIGERAAAAFAFRVVGPLSHQLRPSEYEDVASAFVVATTETEEKDQAYREAWRACVAINKPFAEIVADKLRVALFGEAISTSRRSGVLPVHRPAHTILNMLRWEPETA